MLLQLLEQKGNASTARNSGITDAALSAQGDYATATAEIDAALAEEDATHTARTIRLLDAGLEQDLLRRDVPAAAARIVKKADLEEGRDLWQIQKEWYEHGRDKGLNLDLEIAIAIAHHLLRCANTSDDRGSALGSLGATLRTLGEREAGTARLEEARTTFRAALEVFTRDCVPFDWARTRMNLAALDIAFFDKGDGPARLDSAEARLRAAQQVFVQAGASYYIALTDQTLAKAQARRHADPT